MKEYKSADIRNFAIVGHGSCGKTMLSESLLACSGKINRLGTIANGNTASDYNEDEKERKISIHSSLLNTQWQGKKFNIIDVPGFADFVGEACGAIRVVDLAAVVVHAGQGVEVGTEQMWEKATKSKIPKLLVVTALDKEFVNFDEVLTATKESFGNRVFPLTLPINVGPGFNQVLDVINKKIITYKTDGSGKFEVKDAEGELKEKADSLYEELIEFVAESDEALLEKFFEEGSLSAEEMQKGLHAALQSQSVIPLFTVSGETNIGVSALMDFIASYGSSSLDHSIAEAVNNKEEKVEVKLSDNEPVAFIFKTVSEAHVGDLSFFKVYSGNIKTGMTLHNSSRDRSERFGQMFVLNGKERDAVEVLHAGDIGAVVKLKDSHTGNTLCDPKKIVALPKIEYPRPNINIAIKPKSKGDEEKLGHGLSTIREEDPTFVYTADSELRQTVMSGQGELHLEVIASRLKKRFNIEIDMLKPKIRFRETINGKSEARYRHKKQSGGAGQFAEVCVRIEPLSKDKEVEFTNSLVGQNVDRVFVPSVEKGVKSASVEGILAGYKVVATKVDFYDGKQHPVDSKDIAFQIAGKKAFREAFLAAKPCLLEPIMNIEVKVPEDFMGDVMGDISSKRGKILGMDSEGKFQVIKAQVPQAELYKYSTTLRSITGGRGIHCEELSHYEEMPADQQQKVVDSSLKEREVEH